MRTSESNTTGFIKSLTKDIKLIICDVNMPEMDGLTMCDEVAANAEINKIPIIMLTTQCSDEMKARGKKVVSWHG